MKVKYVNDNITIRELSENHWNGCKYSTLKFINDAIINEEYEASKGFNDDYYEVYIGEEEYLVNVKLFEIVEDKSKKIEKIKTVGCNVAIPALNDELVGTDTPLALELVICKLNEIIDILNEGDK